MIITGGVQMQHVGTGRQVYLSGSCPDMQCSWGMPPLGKDPTTSALNPDERIIGRAQAPFRSAGAAGLGAPAHLRQHTRPGTAVTPRV